MKFLARQFQRSVLWLIPILFVLILVIVTCGKKSGPLPPIPIVPQSPNENRMRQSGDAFLYIFQLPTLNTDNTPAEISKIEIYKLIDPRVVLDETQTQTQTAPTQTQSQTQTSPQSQSAPSQTQTQTQTNLVDQIVLQPETQTMPQTAAAGAQTQTQTSQTQSQTTQSQSQTAQSQTQTQTQKKPEDARTVEEKEFKSRSEQVAEIQGDQVEGYIRNGYFIYVQKLNLQLNSEEFKNWTYYGAKIYSKKGKSGGYTKLVALFPAPVPKTPSNFIATIDEQGIHLVWQPVTTDIFGRLFSGRLG